MPTRINKPRLLAGAGESWVARITLGLFRSRHVRLDPRTLPDYLKRDMGFLDGRGPGNKGC